MSAIPASMIEVAGLTRRFGNFAAGFACFGGEQIARHAIALSSRDTPGRRFGSQRCAAIRARSLKLFVRAGAQPPVWSSPALEEVRSPPAPQMRAPLMAETSLVA
jgi:hypothetical protein